MAIRLTGGRPCLRTALWAAVAWLAVVIGLALAPQGATAEEPAGTLARVKNTSEIRLGYRTDAPPFSFTQPDGQPAGYSVDICRRVAASVAAMLGIEEVKIDHVPVSAAERLSAVEQGTIDIECGVTTITLDRRETVDFSLAIFITGGSLMVPKASAANTVADLAGSRIAVVRNTTTAPALAAYLDREEVLAELVEVEDRGAELRKLDAGDVAAMASDRMVLIGLIGSEGRGGRYRLLPDLFSYEPYALTVPKNDAAFRLAVDRALVDLFRSGGIEDIFDKWLAPLGVSLEPTVERIFYLQALPE